MLAAGLVSVVEAALELVSPSAAAKDLELASMFTHAPPAEIHSDPVRIQVRFHYAGAERSLTRSLQQILTNLLANAIKFTERGSVIVTVATKATGDPTRIDLSLTVRDTGVGIPPEKIGSLFKVRQRSRRPV